jgi:hypothetical protein
MRSEIGATVAANDTLAKFRKRHDHRWATIDGAIDTQAEPPVS